MGWSNIETSTKPPVWVSKKIFYEISDVNSATIQATEKSNKGFTASRLENRALSPEQLSTPVQNCRYTTMRMRKWSDRKCGTLFTAVQQIRSRKMQADEKRRSHRNESSKTPGKSEVYQIHVRVCRRHRKIETYVKQGWKYYTPLLDISSHKA